MLSVNARGGEGVWDTAGVSPITCSCTLREVNEEYMMLPVDRLIDASGSNDGVRLVH